MVLQQDTNNSRARTSPNQNQHTYSHPVDIAARTEAAAVSLQGLHNLTLSLVSGRLQSLLRRRHSVVPTKLVLCHRTQNL